MEGGANLALNFLSELFAVSVLSVVSMAKSLLLHLRVGVVVMVTNGTCRLHIVAP